MKSLNLGEFFKHGCAEYTITNGLKEAWSQVMVDDFVFEESSAYQPHRIPTWDKIDTTFVPPAYINMAESFINSGVFSEYFNVHGKFDSYDYMLHQTLNGYENLWHGHYKDGTHVHLLFYLGSSNRKESDGGKIEVGRIPYTEEIQFGDYHNIHGKYEIEKTGSFVANHGKVVVVWNANPYIVHQVTKVTSDVPRYTLMVACGYKSNFNPDRKRVSIHL